MPPSHSFNACILIYLNFKPVLYLHCRVYTNGRQLVSDSSSIENHVWQLIFYFDDNLFWEDPQTFCFTLKQTIKNVNALVTMSIVRSTAKQLYNCESCRS